MLVTADLDNAGKLYDYCRKSNSCVPYYFDVSFEAWQKSMFRDTDYDGAPLFSRLETYMLVNEGNIEGFIQLGTTHFVFDEHGDKDYAHTYAMIRTLHCLPEARNAHLLMDKADAFFADMRHERRYAFFHYFGMSCYARQGKLHASQFYIEKLLQDRGYVKEHENVYFTKDLRQSPISETDDIHFAYGDDGQTAVFLVNGKRIGGCELNITFNPKICFLKWIYIEKEYVHQGWGTKCMHMLCGELKQKGFDRLDTDTVDSNVNAQGYYRKTGFLDKGIMRSYAVR